MVNQKFPYSCKRYYPELGLLRNFHYRHHISDSYRARARDTGRAPLPSIQQLVQCDHMVNCCHGSILFNRTGSDVYEKLNVLMPDLNRIHKEIEIS